VPKNISIAIEKQSSKKSTSFQALIPDDEIIRMAQASKDAGEFSALWRGDWQDRYKSQSEADYALCRKLAFWCGRDENQIDRLFAAAGCFAKSGTPSTARAAKPMGRPPCAGPEEKAPLR
jgi:primase-polymerase (primpol)-like protein